MSSGAAALKAWFNSLTAEEQGDVIGLLATPLPEGLLLKRQTRFDGFYAGPAPAKAPHAPAVCSACGQSLPSA